MVRSTITNLFQEVAREQQRQLAPLTDDLKLLQCGLDSLSFALIVARLEDALGYDPFDTAESFPVPARSSTLMESSRLSHPMPPDATSLSTEPAASAATAVP